MKLRLSDVTKQYGSRPALRGITMEIPGGTIAAIMGPNGAGKSTLLRAIATISPPDTGTIHCDDRPLLRSDMDLRRRIMFLPDFPVLFTTESVLKNLSIILRLHECDTAAGIDRLTELLGEFDLLPSAEKPVSELSRGQAYKVGLVALLAVNPDLWLLDEPFASGMDPNSLSALKRHLRAAAAAGRTILFSTQILEVAEPLAGFACILDQGRAAACGPMSDLLARSGSLELLFAQLRMN